MYMPSAASDSTTRNKIAFDLGAIDALFRLPDARLQPFGTALPQVANGSR